jgi:hypothetical protein
MRKGGGSVGRAVEGAGAALAREPADPGQPVRGSHHEAGEVGHAAGPQQRFEPAEVAAERRHVARRRAPAEGTQELAVGEGAAGPRGADQEARETVQVDQGWPPSIG